MEEIKQIVNLYPEEVRKKSGILYYVGSSLDITDILIFENVDLFIHQDINNWDLTPLLESFKSNGLIEDFKVEGNIIEVKVNGKTKKVILYFGMDKGDITKHIAEEVKNGFDILFVPSIMNKSILEATIFQTLPLVKEEGLIISSLELKEELGVERISEKPVNIYKKVKNLSSEEIKQIIGNPIQKIKEETENIMKKVRELAPKPREGLENLL